MNSEEFKKYLSQFNPNDNISFIVGNPTKEIRKVYLVEKVICITDMKTPCIFIEVGKVKNMDEENLEHTNLEDQMTIDEWLGA